MKQIVFETLESTNDYAKKLAKSSEWNHEPLCIIAKEQTKGRGRLGRTWESEKEAGIYMSLLLRPGLKPDAISQITLVMALAARNGIEKVTGLEMGIKWPNDLVINGKKICGILTEMGIQEMDVDYVVIGIGVNVAQTSFSPAVQMKATSLCTEKQSLLNEPIDELKQQIIEAILKEWPLYYEMFCRTGDLSVIIDEYNAQCVNVGEKVCILEAENERTGMAKGIDRTGHLIVETERGREYISSGEVSVRGIYGYV